MHLNSEPSLELCRYVLDEYEPPADKDMLAFFQCSIRRPYSMSASHGGMRKGIRLATGKDPRRDFDDCRCHVVVLSSHIGPVPYELEDTYPANMRGGGVKHMSDEEYEFAKPILAQRMAAYIKRWHERYKVITTFTHGRYGEVMEAARELSGVDFSILPDAGGMYLKGARQYWTKYWIQLFYELVGGMAEQERKEAVKRLRAEGGQFGRLGETRFP